MSLLKQVQVGRKLKPLALMLHAPHGIGKSTFGSMAEDTYIDGGANSRTISAIYYTEVCSGSNDDNLYFGLDQTSVADSDAAFVSIDYNGQNYTRASRNVYHATLGGATTWIWTNITPNGPVSGNPALKVNI